MVTSVQVNPPVKPLNVIKLKLLLEESHMSVRTIFLTMAWA